MTGMTKNPNDKKQPNNQAPKKGKVVHWLPVNATRAEIEAFVARVKAS